MIYLFNISEAERNMSKHQFDPIYGAHEEYFCGNCGWYFSEPAFTQARADEPAHALCPDCNNPEFDDCAELAGAGYEE
jgi:hypothetical protein